jgi:hypothetical protein
MGIGDVVSHSVPICVGDALPHAIIVVEDIRAKMEVALKPADECSKATLIRTIANEQLEGFHRRDELKSIVVEHDIEDEMVVVQMMVNLSQRGQTRLW